MTTFTATALVNSRYLVEGSDTAGNTGSTIVDGSQWDLIREQHRVRDAEAAFDAEVEAFYAPLTEAADRVGKAAGPKLDPMQFLVVQEGVEPEAGQREQLVQLSTGSIILRIIASGDTSRLRWVGDDLVVVAAQVEPEANDDEPIQAVVDVTEPSTAADDNPF